MLLARTFVPWNIWLIKLTSFWRAIFLTVVRVIAKLVFQKWFQVSEPRRTTNTPFVFIVHFLHPYFQSRLLMA